MSRFNARALDPEGYADGTKVVGIAGGRAAWVDPSAVAGGGGGVGNDPRWNVLTGQTSVDEFNDGTLDAAWTRVDKSGNSGRATWTEDGDTLGVLNTSGDANAELHAMMRPLSGAGGSLTAGDGFVTCIRLLPNGASTTLSLCGITLADGVTSGSGTQACGHVFNSSASPAVLSSGCDKFTNYQTQTTPGTNIATAGTFAYLRLAMISSTSYRADISPDAVTWKKGTAVTISSFTPAYVGFHTSSWGSASANHAVSFEFLRRVSGVT